jgi:hypothetical protein
MAINMKRLALHLKQASKGQSFVELALVMLVLLVLVVGMIETANLLNQYIGIVDGAREGARYASAFDPFAPVPAGHCTFEDCVDEVIEGSNGGAGALSPIVLDPTSDDLVISYFTVIQGPPVSLIRWPNNADHYWRKYGNHASKVTELQIISAIDANAPSTGVVVIEIFYDYHQLLHMHMPIEIPFIPDPVPVYTYSIMPLSAAEPTATLCPTNAGTGTC